MRPKVLYIEDNDQNFYLVNFILSTHGYEVIRAREGFEGIEVANRCNADLILLDIQLPIVDGYTVARTLRTNPKLATTPIIALTSYAMVGDREKALEAGCNGYIEKPLNPDTFLQEIERYIKGRD